MNVNKVGEEEVKLPDGDVDVVWVDAEVWMKTIRRFLQSLTVRALQGHGLEQDHLDQVKTPDLRRKMAPSLHDLNAFNFQLIRAENI